MCCSVESSASGRSLVKRIPTECGVSECDREYSESEEALAHWWLLHHGQKKYIDLWSVQWSLYLPTVVKLKNSAFCLQGMRADGFRKFPWRDNDHAHEDRGADRLFCKLWTGHSYLWSSNACFWLFCSILFLLNDPQNSVIYEQDVLDVTRMVCSILRPKKRQLSCPEHDALLCVCLRCARLVHISAGQQTDRL